MVSSNDLTEEKHHGDRRSDRAGLRGAAAGGGVWQEDSHHRADIIHKLKSFGAEVFVHDSEADPEEAMDELGVRLLSWEQLPRADARTDSRGHLSQGHQERLLRRCQVRL